MRKLGAPRQRELEPLDRFDGEELEQGLRELAGAFADTKLGPVELFSVGLERKKAPPRSR